MTALRLETHGDEVAWLANGKASAPHAKVSPVCSIAEGRACVPHEVRLLRSSQRSLCAPFAIGLARAAMVYHRVARALPAPVKKNSSHILFNTPQHTCFIRSATYLSPMPKLPTMNATEAHRCVLIRHANFINHYFRQKSLTLLSQLSVLHPRKALLARAIARAYHRTALSLQARASAILRLARAKCVGGLLVLPSAVRCDRKRSHASRAIRVSPTRPSKYPRHRLSLL